MKCEKHWYNYIFLVLLAVMICVPMSTDIVTICIRNFKMSEYVSIAIVCGVIFVLIVLFLSIKFLYRCFYKCLKISKHAKKMWEWLFILSGIAGYTLLSISELQKADNIIISDMTYYNISFVGSNLKMLQFFNGVNYLYCHFLHSILALFGNNEIYAIIVNMILYGIAVLILYFAIREFDGRKVSIPTYVLLIFLPTLKSNCFEINPQILFLTFFSIGLLLLSKYYKQDSIALAVITGIYMAFLLWLDFLSVSLCVLLLIGVLSGKWKSRVTGIIVTCLSFAGIWGIGTLSSKISYVDSILKYLGKYFYQIDVHSSDFFRNMYNYQMLILLGLSFLSIIGFFFIKKEFITKWALITFIACIYSLITYHYEFGWNLVSILFSILAGLGISCMFYQEAKIEEDLIILEEPTPIKEQKVKNEVVNKEELSFEKNIDISKEKNSMVMDKTIEETPERKPVKFIENPLPGPKKHVHKELDYGYELSEKDMHYDIEIKENDDFDIE